jgi:hypothetical protein
MKRGPVFLRRLPSLRWRPPPEEDQDILPRGAKTSYPNLIPDLAFLDQALMPDFRRLDRDALRCQNNFYLAQLTLIVGGALATILGAVQAGLGGNLALGLLETAVAAVIGLGALRTGAQTAQQGYFGNRLRAERLRSEYFLYLAGVPPYADEKRQQTLKRTVAQVANAEERA